MHQLPNLEETKTLIKICVALGCDMEDILEIVPDESE